MKGGGAPSKHKATGIISHSRDIDLVLMPTNIDGLQSWAGFLFKLIPVLQSVVQPDLNIKPQELWRKTSGFFFFNSLTNIPLIVAVSSLLVAALAPKGLLWCYFFPSLDLQSLLSLYAFYQTEKHAMWVKTWENIEDFEKQSCNWSVCVAFDVLLFSIVP